MRKKRQSRLIIWAAKGMFKSARKLATALKPETEGRPRPDFRKVLIVRSNSLRFKPRFSDVVINWGNSNTPAWAKNILPPLINNVNSVSFAVNKLTTFKMLQDKCNIPEWTTDPEIALSWFGDVNKVIEENEHKSPLVITRATLTGFGGEGINIWDAAGAVAGRPEDFKKAPLYVQYKKKKKEFRVHVFKGEVIDVTQKKKRKDFDGEVNTKIRNYGNGWVYCREDIEPLPEDLTSQAITAVHALGLDFGAVDAIYNEKENKTYILEINSAPGMEGQTIEAYKNAILKELR